MVKPVDKHQYPRIDSCHPHHCKTLIPYSQVLHHHQICSKENKLSKVDLQTQKESIEVGLSRAAINHEIQRALDMSRENYLQVHPDQDKPAHMPLVVTFQPSFQSITKWHLSIILHALE